MPRPKLSQRLAAVPISGQLSRPITILLGEWLPDQPALANPGCIVARNALPAIGGYKSVKGAVKDPWVWPDEDTVVDEALQARAYRAIFRMFDDASWSGGLFWWNWLTEPQPGQKFARSFTPKEKKRSGSCGRRGARRESREGKFTTEARRARKTRRRNKAAGWPPCFVMHDA